MILTDIITLHNTTVDAFFVYVAYIHVHIRMYGDEIEYSNLLSRCSLYHIMGTIRYFVLRREIMRNTCVTKRFFLNIEIF